MYKYGKRTLDTDYKRTLDTGYNENHDLVLKVFSSQAIDTESSIAALLFESQFLFVT